MSLLLSLAFMGLIFICLDGVCSEEVAPFYKASGKNVIKASKFGYACNCNEDEWDPICATDGYTYPSKCVLLCARKAAAPNKLLGVCKGECPCCRPAYTNEPIEQTQQTSSLSPGWGQTQETSSLSPGWGPWGWGPPPPVPFLYSLPHASSSPVLPPSSKPQTSGNSGWHAPGMSGPYGYYGPFRGDLADEVSDTKESSNSSSCKTEGENEENIPREDAGEKADAVKLAFAPNSGLTSTCLCTSVYNPICGSNNVTYTNLCEFKCATKKDSCLTQACQGECPCCSCSGGVVFLPPST